MATFFLSYHDLSNETQSYINEVLYKEIVEYFKLEARKNNKELKEYMCSRKGYNIDEETYAYDFENLVSELIDARIQKNFKSLRADL